ncbi:YqhR family membrane protein [Tuberibacillus sp. Marseille-P3662]|uniref:YqhR family membrane protein n=1 Tax=Tuberibacillus sp. Marseille-P3662 TaxID=1965358 RepID=UPI0020CAA13B|nr:YqhR family membrane protein [Tuberibacillus sp. Marseille-P3662]
MAEQKRLEQNKDEHQLTTNGRVVLIGLFGGIIWGLIGYLVYLFRFTKFGPALTLEPFALGNIKEGTSGQWWGLLALCVISVILAFIYKFTLGRVKNMWVSIFFGLALWVAVFYILQPWIPDLPYVTDLGINTISTTLCLYVLWGLFVGYSISFDLVSTSNAEKAAKEEKSGAQSSK